MAFKFIILFVCAFTICNSQTNVKKIKQHFKSKNYQLTIDELATIATSEINFDSLLYMKAYSQIKLNQLKDANTTLNQLQQINTNYYEVYFLRGLLFALKNNHPNAIENFNKVIAKDEFHEKALYNRAISKGLLQDYASAIKDLNVCVEKNKNYTVAYYNRGYWNELLEQFDAAILDYKKAIELDAHYTEAYIALTYLYSQKGDKINACETIQKAKTEGVEAANDLITLFCK